MLMMIQVNYHSAWTPPGKKKSQQLDDCQFSCIFNRAQDNWSISWNSILVKFRQKWSIYVWLRMYLFCNHCTLQTIVEKILFVWSNLFEHLVDPFTYFWIVTIGMYDQQKDELVVTGEPSQVISVTLISESDRQL